MIGLTVFMMLALFGGVFMVFALAKFHGELKRLKLTRQVHCESHLRHVLPAFARGTASLAEPSGNRQVHRLSAPHLGRKDVLNFRKQSVGL